MFAIHQPLPPPFGSATALTGRDESDRGVDPWDHHLFGLPRLAPKSPKEARVPVLAALMALGSARSTPHAFESIDCVSACRSAREHFRGQPHVVQGPG